MFHPLKLFYIISISVDTVWTPTDRRIKLGLLEQICASVGTLVTSAVNTMNDSSDVYLDVKSYAKFENENVVRTGSKISL